MRRSSRQAHSRALFLVDQTIRVVYTSLPAVPLNEVPRQGHAVLQGYTADRSQDKMSYDPSLPTGLPAQVHGQGHLDHRVHTRLQAKGAPLHSAEHNNAPLFARTTGLTQQQSVPIRNRLTMAKPPDVSLKIPG